MPQDKIPLLKSKSREHERGVVLVSTLALLLLFAATTSLVQIKLLGNVQVVKRLTQKSESAVAKTAVRELMRPLIAEGIINFDSDTQLELDGTPYEITYAGRAFQVSVQDVDGLISPLFTRADIVRELLPSVLADKVLEMRAKEDAVLPLHMSFGLVTLNGNELVEPHLWITSKSTHPTPNGAALSHLYNPTGRGTMQRLARRQPDQVVLHIEERFDDL